MSLTKALEIISVFRNIYSKKKARRDLNCVGYKYKGVKSEISYSNFYSGIKVTYIRVKTRFRKGKKNHSRWVKEIGIAV